MPTGIYPRTMEHNRNISKSLKGRVSGMKGKHQSGEWRRNQSIRMTGENNPFYGRHHTEETKMINAEAHRVKPSGMKGKKLPKEQVDNMIKIRKGKHYSPQTEFKKGYTPWNKDKHGIYSEETLGKMSESRKNQIPWNKDTKGICKPNKGSFKKGQMDLEKHWNWQDGKSFEPYGLDFNNKFKEAIRARDNYCCVICNKMQEELNHKLDIHHVDYDKTNSFPQNCVSLCRNNHTETNFNRQSWTKFFQSLLKERYGYEYTEDQKIILDFCRR